MTSTSPGRTAPTNRRLPLRTASTTLVMVFVLQHTQTRQQAALHHKLDEVLHALPEADDRLIKLETASDSELVEVELRHIALRDDAHEG